MPSTYNGQNGPLKPTGFITRVPKKYRYNPIIEKKVNYCTRCRFPKFNPELQTHLTTHCFKYVCNKCEPFDITIPMQDRPMIRLMFETYSKMSISPKTGTNFEIMFGINNKNFLGKTYTSYSTEYYRRLHVMNGIRVLSSDHEAECERPLGEKFDWRRIPDWQDWFSEERPHW